MNSAMLEKAHQPLGPLPAQHSLSEVHGGRPGSTLADSKLVDKRIRRIDIARDMQPLTYR